MFNSQVDVFSASIRLSRATLCSFLFIYRRLFNPQVFLCDLLFLIHAVVQLSAVY